MLKFPQMIVLFVPDVDAAARWYAELFGAEVQHENPRFAFIAVPGLQLGFHPADAKCPGGVGGTTVYWEVDDIDEAIDSLRQRGARLHRGPAITSLGAGAALLIDPFGCTIGLNRQARRPFGSRPAVPTVPPTSAHRPGPSYTVHDDADDLPALAEIDRGLDAFNRGEPELQRVQPLSVVAADAAGSVVAGAVGRTWGECCELQQLWVDPAWRGQGIGSGLMQRFEAAAASRGCRLAYLDTFSFQAPAFYARRGYRTVLATQGFSAGIVKHTMHKPLRPAD